MNTQTAHASRSNASLGRPANTPRSGTQPSSQNTREVYQPAATEKIAVLLNRNAKQVDERVVRRLSEKVPAADFYVSRSLEEGETLARQIVQKGYGTILSGGGDGTLVNTVNQVFRYVDEANEWRRQRTRLNGDEQALLSYPEFGVLKLGTGNGLSHVVGAQNPSADLLRVLTGLRHPALNLDLIEAEGSKFFFAGMGYDGQILNDYNTIKSWASRSPWLKRLTATAAGYLGAVVAKTVPHLLKHGFSQQVRVTNMDEEAYFIDPRRGDRAVALKPGQVLYEGPAAMIGAGTIPFYGFGFTMYPFAGVRPGYMNLRIGTCGPLKVLANLPSVWRGTWRNPELLDFHVRSVRIESDKSFPYQHSGDGQGTRSKLELRMASTPLKLVDFHGPLHGPSI